MIEKGKDRYSYGRNLTSIPIEPEYVQDAEQMKIIVQKANAWNESQKKHSTPRNQTK
jgi:hypothetical protein